MMCHPCPLVVRQRCVAYKRTLSRWVGVLDGEVRDDWGDLPPDNEEEDA